MILSRCPALPQIPRTADVPRQAPVDHRQRRQVHAGVRVLSRVGARLLRLRDPHPEPGPAGRCRREVLLRIRLSPLLPVAGRAPDGHVALTVMVGGSRQPELARLTAGELLAAVTPDLQALLGVNGDPTFQRHAFWPRAIPQYNLGYETYLETMSATERLHDGLYLGGQARDGGVHGHARS